MIGVYDYTVVLTYISLMSSIIGMFLAFRGCLGWSICCLALSGLLDGFDGKVARTKKDRTDIEKRYGIQIDSLCDVICFGVFPVIICWHSGMQGILGGAILCFYCLAGLIRLAYFNVMEEVRQKDTSENRKYYQGMPITSIAVILPLVYVASQIFAQNFLPVLNITMLITGLLFIIDFKFRKPTNQELTLLIVIVGIAVIYLLYRFNWKEYMSLNLKDYIQWKWKTLGEILQKNK